MSTMQTWIDDLGQNDLSAQISAAEALAGLGKAAQGAIVALVEGCGSSDEDVRNWCTAALEEVGPPAAGQIEDLKSLASAAENDIAFWAVTMLGRAQAADAVPILTERLHDASAPAMQKRAAWALEKINAAYGLSNNSHLRRMRSSL